MFLLLTLLLLKHFIIDFPLQVPYQWMNKGTYGHPGGIVHSGLHVMGTIAVMLLYGMVYPDTLEDGYVLVFIWLNEFLIHYHIDWAKMNINNYYGLKCNESPRFWDLVGIDQLLHNLTYLGITYVCLK